MLDELAVGMLDCELGILEDVLGILGELEELEDVLGMLGDEGDELEELGLGMLGEDDDEELEVVSQPISTKASTKVEMPGSK